MKSEFIYAFRFLTYNKKRTFSVLLSFVLASTMISVCFFTIDSIDKTIWVDAKSESGGYNLMLVDEKSSTDSFISENKSIITQVDQIELIGNISPNLYVSYDLRIVEQLISLKKLNILGDFPNEGEILINQMDYSYFGNPEIGDPVTVEIDCFDGKKIFETFKVSGIYSGNNYSFIDNLPVSWIGENSIDHNLLSDTDIMSFIQTASGEDGQSLYRNLERVAQNHINENKNYKFSQYLTYNSILSGSSGTSIYFIFFIAIVSAIIMIVGTQIIMLRDELVSFSIIQDIGAGFKNFIYVSLAKNVMICSVSLPISFLLSLFIVYWLTYLSDIRYVFYVSVGSVLVSFFLPFVLVFIITLSSVLIVKKSSGSSFGYSVVSNLMLEENKSFGLRYLWKRFLYQINFNTVFIIATVLSVSCLSAFVYTIDICNINIKTIDNRLSSETPFIAVYANGKDVGISEYDIEKTRSLSDIVGLKAETSYYSEFVMQPDQTVFVSQKLDDKDISRMFSNSGNSRYIKADLIYSDSLSDILFDHNGSVVEGDIDLIFSDENFGYVVVVDNFWTQNSEKCYHVGDEIILQNCEFDRMNSLYTPIGNDSKILTVCAVIRTELGDIYNGFTSFPLYVGFETYKQLTGYDRYKKLSVYSYPELNSNVERNLGHIFRTTEDWDKQIIIVNQFDGYNEDREFTIRTKSFVGSVFLILMILVFLDIFFIGYSKIMSENKETIILTNIGVPKTEFIKIAFWELLFYTVLELCFVSIINSYVLKIIFDTFRASSVFPKDVLWNYPIDVLVFNLIFLILINLVSIIASTIHVLKESEENGYAENL